MIIMIMIIIIIIIMMIIKMAPRPRNTGLMSSGDSLILWGEGASSALVGNPSRDGVSIKILVWGHLQNPTSNYE